VVSLSARKAAAGGSPASRARRTVSWSTMPPAAWLAPSTPSVAMLATTAKLGKIESGSAGGHRQLLVPSARARRRVR
jgi:hypothetical protein